ncbi:hypothetical protein SAMN05421811_113184 [Nonomuraea wenchangensis]|uniref:Uncharacterized protein n=1 Tax=Nonomuraea wenchangensis TaxID=568860 RepID=A0A1I0LA41_9ACTN|nr:hypothetical protein SAMN05421811_113184 [Nonomuraea wenchangensis]
MLNSLREGDQLRPQRTGRHAPERGGAAPGGRGHTRECLALVTDDVLRRCARPGCGRAKPDREPGKGGRPSKYCCKLCGNFLDDSAPAAMVTHTAVSAFTAEAGQIRAALQQRDAELAAEREDLRRLDERLEQVWQAVAAQLAQAETRVQQAEADAEQARTAMRAAHADRQTAEQERDAALHAQREALGAQHAAEEHRDRVSATPTPTARRPNRNATRPCTPSGKPWAPSTRPRNTATVSTPKPAPTPNASASRSATSPPG